jgi:hypothetical protein
VSQLYWHGGQPATKQDLAEVRTEMKAMEDRLIEVFRDSQTELREAFVSFTEFQPAAGEPA